MATQKTNLMWKTFQGLRKLNSVNSDSELGADVAANVYLSKEKSGQNRSIKTSGWFNDYLSLSEPIIRLFSANLSGYANPNQLIAFTKSGTNINAWIIEDDSGILEPAVQIASFPLAQDVTSVTMVQFGDRMVVACAFNTDMIGFIAYSATPLPGWVNQGGQWYYQNPVIQEATTQSTVNNISELVPFGSRLAINGQTTYSQQGIESIFGVWFSEAGNPIQFTKDFITAATNTSAFFAETGEYVNKLIEYNGLTAGCQNRMYNVRGGSQADYGVDTLTAKGVFGNAMFVINGQCAYVDSYANNIFVLKNNIDGTIGFDSPIGDDIMDFLSDVKDVTINSLGRRVRMLKSTGESLCYDVDIGEWTIERFAKNSRAVTFLNKEIMCDGTLTTKQITLVRMPTSVQLADNDGFFSRYRSNLMWLDSQSSLKSHIYPFAIILEPQTNNDFFIRFITDRRHIYTARVTRAGFANIATYSGSSAVPEDGSQFVADAADLSGRVFMSAQGSELLVTIDRPPAWRYLQIEIYTNQPGMEFNISGIEGKQTFITDEMLDY